MSMQSFSAGCGGQSCHREREWECSSECVLQVSRSVSGIAESGGRCNDAGIALTALSYIAFIHCAHCPPLHCSHSLCSLPSLQVQAGGTASAATAAVLSEGDLGSYLTVLSTTVAQTGDASFDVTAESISGSSSGDAKFSVFSKHRSPSYAWTLSCGWPLSS